MPRIVGAVERSPAQCNKFIRRKHASRVESRETLNRKPRASYVLDSFRGRGFDATRPEQHHINFGRSDTAAQQSLLFKTSTYRLEELLVHEERLTTSGVGTGEQ